MRIYRADHIGSLLRPAAIIAARAGELAPDRLRLIEDEHILRVLQRQRDLGFRIVTDGEFRRRGFMADFYESVTGWDHEVAVERSWFSRGATQFEATSRSTSPVGLVVDRIRQTRRLTEHEATFLLRHHPGGSKMTVPSANQFPAIAYRSGLTDRAYPTHSALLWDIVPIIRSEIAALADEGMTVIQLDAPRYSYFLDPTLRSCITRDTGITIREAIDEAIRADNASLAGARHADTVLAMHLCRGNNRSRWYAEGGYDPIAEQLFNELDVDLFLLEYDSPRAGTFAPLRFVPKHKGVVLGLVSTKYPELESRDDLMRAIEDAARYVPIENLALSPQCGFASTLEGNLIDEEQQWRKLQLVADTARAVWPDA